MPVKSVVKTVVKSVVKSSRMVTRSQTNNRPRVNYYEGDSDVETNNDCDSEYEYMSEEEEDMQIHGPTTQSRRIIQDVEVLPRMMTRSAAKAQIQIDFDGASRAWRKAHHKHL